MRGNWNLAKTLFENVLDFFSMRRNWILAKTIFETVLEYFR